MSDAETPPSKALGDGLSRACSQAAWEQYATFHMASSLCELLSVLPLADLPANYQPEPLDGLKPACQSCLGDTLQDSRQDLQTLLERLDDGAQRSVVGIGSALDEEHVLGRSSRDERLRSAQALGSMPLPPFLRCGALPPPSAPSLAPQRDEAAASASARTVRLQTHLAIEITSDLLLVAQLDVHGPLVQVQLLRWDTIAASEGRVILPGVSEQRVEDLV